MDVAELRGLALNLYDRASLDPAHEHGALRVARSLPDVVIEHISLDGPHAMTFRRRDQIVIRIERCLPRNAAEFACGHELGHHAVALARRSNERIERICDAIGAEVCVPAPALSRARGRHGWRVVALARDLATTQTIVALRWGEVFDEPCAVVTPKRVLRRGLPLAVPDSELRRIALTGGCREIEAQPIADSRGRWALRAAI